MGRFQYIGHCIDVILSCTDEELKSFGFLEYVNSLRKIISTQSWGQIELYFALMMKMIEMKRGKQNENR